MCQDGGARVEQKLKFSPLIVATQQVMPKLEI